MRPAREQTVLVTGATDGLGRAVARELASGGATVLVHGRSRERIERTVRELEEAGRGTGAHVHGHLADLASLEQVRRLATEVERGHERLDVLVNNAGTVSERREVSADGHELTFAVNHLSHFALTLLLLPLLRRSAPARIVNVASIGQRRIDFDDVMLERRYDAFGAYAQSKLAQVMFTFELAERLEAGRDTGVTVNALHPATLMDTKMVREHFGRGRSTVAEGVRALMRLVGSDDVRGLSGRYFDGLEEAAADPQAYDADARRRLWRLSEELTAARA